MVTHRAEIEKLVKIRTSNKKIKKILEEKHGSNISLGALQKARKLWKIKCPHLKDFKTQILKWDSDGEGTGEIIEHIFKVYGHRFTWPTVYTQINKWNGGKKKEWTRVALKAGRIWNLDPYRDDFLGWKKDGLDIEGILQEFEKKHNLYTSANNLEKSLKSWDLIWQDIGVSRKTPPMDQRTKRDIESMEISI